MTDGGIATGTIPALVLENGIRRGPARGLLELGVGPGHDVAILLGNTVEHLLLDHATAHCGAATISIYATFSDEQLAHVLSDSQPLVLVVPDDASAKRVRALDWAEPDLFQIVTVASTERAFDFPLDPATMTRFLAAQGIDTSQITHGGADHPLVKAEPDRLVAEANLSSPRPSRSRGTPCSPTAGPLKEASSQPR